VREEAGVFEIVQPGEAGAIEGDPLMAAVEEGLQELAQDSSNQSRSESDIEESKDEMPVDIDDVLVQVEQSLSPDIQPLTQPSPIHAVQTHEFN
jgi:hypothetical protein